MRISDDKKFLYVLLSFVFVIALSGVPVSGFQKANAGASSDGAPTNASPLSESDLRGLVAPIALYPDNLVAQILAASTYPDQVAIADYWVQEHKNLTGSALSQEVETQSWNASVKALTQFPSVLHNMAQSLSWTSQLGEAYHNQKSAVMAAIQTLRAQAKSAGNLKSTSQIIVQQQSPQTIVIQPANPNIVYVPEYNPAVIYGYPYVTPGYTAGQVAAASALSFGAGVAVGALTAGGGWNSWGCNWSGGSVTYNHNTFVGNTAWHGGYAGGIHPYGYNGGYHPYGRSDIDKSELNRSNFNELNRSNFDHFSDDNSWAHHDNWAAKSTAFSGSHFGGFGGWSSRADSARGWGSLRGSGFSGFHGFGGFHGGGFGGFHGGGRR